MNNFWVKSLLLIFLLNLVQALGLELAHDEAYYWIYSQNLSWGYYDHPPMVAFFIKIGTTLFGNNEFGVRIFFNLATLLSLYFIRETIDPNKRNDSLILILFLSFPLLQGAGFLALPDTPLVLFASMYFYYLKRYIEKNSLQDVLLLSFSIAAMLYSKYHAGLIIILTLLAVPRLLKLKSFYLVTFTSLLLYTPHLWWQYQHEFVTFKFHLFGRSEKHFDIKNILEYLGGQFLLCGMFLSLVIIPRVWKLKSENVFTRILKFQVFGFLLFLLASSFRNTIEANWTVTIFGVLIVLLCLSGFKTKTALYWGLPIILITLSLRIIMFCGPDQVGIKRLAEFHGWKKASHQILESCEGHKIVANQYQVASKLSFYLKQDIRALHLSGRKSHFSLMPAPVLPDGNVCFLNFNKMDNAKIVRTIYPRDINLVIIDSEEVLKLEK